MSSLPASVRKVEEEPIPEHIQMMFDEAKSGEHHGHDDGHDHHHGHATGYPDAYGLGHSHGW